MDNGPLRAKTLIPAPKQIVRALGWLLSLAALFFFLRLIWWTGLSVPGRDGREVAGVLVLAAMAYGVAVGLLALLWTNLLTAGPSTAAVRLRIAAGYLVSQFAKYLPGNVFQYIGRHMLGRQLGIGHGMLAAAALIEASLLTSAVLVFSLTLGQSVLRALFPEFPYIPTALALMPLLIVPALAWLPRRGRLLCWIPPYSLGRLALSLAGYLLFILVFGGLFWVLLGWASGARYDPWGVIGASSAAWLVGFVIPGAPAGAGLREAALAFATGAVQPTAETLAAIVLFRVATLGGDFLAFIVGLAMEYLSRRKVGAPDP